MNAVAGGLELHVARACFLLRRGDLPTTESQNLAQASLPLDDETRSAPDGIRKAEVRSVSIEDGDPERRCPEIGVRDDAGLVDRSASQLRDALEVGQVTARDLAAL